MSTVLVVLLAFLMTVVLAVFGSSLDGFFGPDEQGRPEDGCLAAFLFFGGIGSVVASLRFVDLLRSVYYQPTFHGAFTVLAAVVTAFIIITVLSVLALAMSSSRLSRSIVDSPERARANLVNLVLLDLWLRLRGRVH